MNDEIRLVDILRRKPRKVRKLTYRVINEETYEYFTVSGATVEGCKIIADQECERLGWDKNNVFSEVIDD